MSRLIADGLWTKLFESKEEVEGNEIIVVAQVEEIAADDVFYWNSK